MIPRVAALLALLALASAPALAFPVVIQGISGPGASGVETRLYVSVPAFLAGASPERAVVTATIHRGQGVAGTSRWTASVSSPGDCRSALETSGTFSLEPGDYVARVRIEVEGGESREAETALRVPDLSPDLALSELILGCRAPTDSLLLPRAPRVEPLDPGMLPCVTFWIGDRLASPDSVYTVRLRVRDPLEATRFTETRSVPRRSGTGECLSGLLDAPLPGGRYRLEVEARLGKRRVEQRIDFEVAGHAGSGRDPWMLRTLLGHVATPEELLWIEDTPDDSLGAFWDRFWARRDPRPETPVNEALVLFEERVDHVARRFGVMEPGWESDRGRIYIRLGPPDRVETLHADAFRSAAEIWYYYGRNATYVFHDVEGFGRYRLVGGR